MLIRTVGGLPGRRSPRVSTRATRRLRSGSCARLVRRQRRGGTDRVGWSGRLAEHRAIGPTRGQRSADDRTGGQRSADDRTTDDRDHRTRATTRGRRASARRQLRLGGGDPRGTVELWAGLRVVELDGRLLLLGGRTPNPSTIPGDSVIHGDVWASADNGSTWTELVEQAPWPARAYFQAVVKDGMVYVIGGQDFGLEENPFCVLLDQGLEPPPGSASIRTCPVRNSSRRRPSSTTSGAAPTASRGSR